MTQKIDVLDHGYVRLVDVMGDDLSVVNAARASYDKESSTMSHKDAKLIDSLVKNYHDSPLRHATMTFEIYAPLMVARQWWKHTVASTHLDDQEGWNESSRRYVTEEPQFYIPDPFKKAPENLKQGSGEPTDYETNDRWTKQLDAWYGYGEDLYKSAMADGIAPEQARLFLPAYGMYVRWRWTASLNALLNFITLRLGEGAQSEMTEYGKVVATLTQNHFPVTVEAWIKHRT